MLRKFTLVNECVTIEQTNLKATYAKHQSF